MVDRTRLALAVDGVPETAGMGIFVSQDGVSTVVRPPRPGSTSYVVFSVAGTTPMEQAGKDSALWHEMKAWGVSCGGAAVSIVGASAVTASVPETGGLSLPAAVMMWSGVGASVGQCWISTYRTTNAALGNNAANQALDDSTGYRATSYVLDGVGLLSAGGDLKELFAVNAALKDAGVSWQVAKTASVGRPARRAFTEAMEIDAVKRLSAVQISKMAKTRIVGLAGDALGVGGSGTQDGGIIHDVTIWIVSKPPPGSQATKH